MYAFFSKFTNNRKTYHVHKKLMSCALILIKQYCGHYSMIGGKCVNLQL